MPGRRPPLPPLDERLCRRCQTQEPSLTVRTEPLCKVCFRRYVQTKVVKRMEGFRVRHSAPGQEPKLLLPLLDSFDSCSLALVHILSQHLTQQAGKSGRSGFRICILHVADDSGVDIIDPQASLAKLQARYPAHDYHSIRLSSILASADVSCLFPAPDTSAATPRDRLCQILGSTKSATSRQDLKQILKRRLVVQSAKDHACEAILWTDSTTKLAERTLAETAKGRGYSLPWIVADADSARAIPSYSPLRDLLNKEINAYLSFLEPPLEDGLLTREIVPSASTKNLTIDHLMKQYFESVEQEYPSIVSNVVRTTGKLHSASLAEVEMQCELCEQPLEGQAPEKSRLCYGCIRLLPAVAT